MELTKFGAVVQFALELERRAAACCQETERQAQGDALSGALAAIAARNRKNAQRLERICRQDVNEMLLEAIQGIDSSNYALSDGAPLREIEATLARYYHDVAARLSLPEAARSFSRLADAHTRDQAILAELAAR
jgi:hypothetical protein